MAKNKTKIVNLYKRKNRIKWNIGLALFAVIFIYLLICIISYLSKDRILVYEVREGSILKDNAFTGLIMRDETVYTAPAGGYINYFYDGGTKVSAFGSAYTLSNDALDESYFSADSEVDLTQEDWNSVQMKIQSFNESFNPSQYHTVKDLKDNIHTIIQNNNSTVRINRLNTMISDGSVSGIDVYPAGDDGIIAYSIDGLENVDESTLYKAISGKIDYVTTNLINNTQVSAGSPIFRLVTGEEWQLAFKIPDEAKESLQKKMGDKTYTNVKIHVLKDDCNIKGSLELREYEGDTYAFISFSKGMVRYIDDRYLDIELIFDDESGLKIPKSAVTEKEFYTIPYDYITNGGASKETGVICQKKGKNESAFKPLSVYYIDHENDLAYINTSDLQEGDTLYMPEASEKYVVGSKQALSGVYNVNRGYAIFKQVEILCENEDYYIVKAGNSYSIFNYDHIALHAEGISDNMIVTQ